VKHTIQCTVLVMLALGSCSLSATKATSTSSSRGRGQQIFLTEDESAKPTFGVADCNSTKQLNIGKKYANPIDFFYRKSQSVENNLDCPLTSATIAGELVPISNKFITVNQLFPSDKTGKVTYPGCNSTPAGAPSDYMLCFYRDTGELIGSSEYTLDTAPTDILAEPTPYPNSVTFAFTVNKQSVQIEVCYGPNSNADKIEADLKAAAQAAAKLGAKAAAEPCTGNYSVYGTTFSSDKTGGTISGLTNKVQYAFAFRLKGETDWQGFVEATPEAVESALAFSDSAGAPGTSWSCHASKDAAPVSSATVMLTLLLALLGWMRCQVNPGMTNRRTSRFLPFMLIGLIAATVLTPTSANADLGDVNVAILGSPYLPNLDGEKKADGTLVKPMYLCFFGASGTQNRPILPFMGIEADAHLIDDFGSLQLGMGAGYTFVSGFAPVEGSITDANRCGEPSSSTVTLHMLQLRPQLTYIFDPYIDVVPLAPYIRGAFVAHGYLFNLNGKPDTGGEAVNRDPIGVRFGYEVAVGLMFLLDILDPTAASQARHLGAYKHSYLKAEVALRDVTSFGSPGFDFSPKDIAFGSSLPLMFNFGLVVEFS